MTNETKTMTYMEAMMLLLEAKNRDDAFGEAAWSLMEDIHESGVWRYWDDMIAVYGKEHPWENFLSTSNKIDADAAMNAAEEHLAQYTPRELREMQKIFTETMVCCVGIKTIFEDKKGAEQK